MFQRQADDLNFRGNVAFRNGRYGAAVDAYTRAIELAGGSARAGHYHGNRCANAASRPAWPPRARPGVRQPPARDPALLAAPGASSPVPSS